MILFLLLITISVFLEGTVMSLPLVLICLLCLTIIKREAVVFPIAFFTGLLLDLLRVNIIGSSSLFFVAFVFLILLYQRKYEINSYPFVAFAGFLGALGYFGMFGGIYIIIQALISSTIAVLLYSIVRIFTLTPSLSLRERV